MIVDGAQSLSDCLTHHFRSLIELFFSAVRLRAKNTVQNVNRCLGVFSGKALSNLVNMVLLVTLPTQNAKGVGVGLDRSCALLVWVDHCIPKILATENQDDLGVRRNHHHHHYQQ